MKPTLFVSAAAAVLAVVLGSATASSVAQAGEWQRSGSYETGAGRSGTYTGTVSGQRGEGWTRNQSITTQNGKTYDRSAHTTYDRSDHEFDRTVTGPGGKTRTTTGTAENGQWSGTYTTGNGKTGTFSGERTRNGEGSYTTDHSWTNANGQTKSSSATSTYDRNTHTLSRTATGPQGGTHQGSVTVTPSAQQ